MCPSAPQAHLPSVCIPTASSDRHSSSRSTSNSHVRVCVLCRFANPRSVLNPAVVWRIEGHPKANNFLLLLLLLWRGRGRREALKAELRGAGSPSLPPGATGRATPCNARRSPCRPPIPLGKVEQCKNRRTIYSAPSPRHPPSRPPCRRLHVVGDNHWSTTGRRTSPRRRQRPPRTPVPITPPLPLSRWLTPLIPAGHPQSRLCLFTNMATAVRALGRAMTGAAAAAAAPLEPERLLPRGRSLGPCHAAARQGHRRRREKRQGGRGPWLKAAAYGWRQVRSINPLGLHSLAKLDLKSPSSELFAYQGKPCQ